MSLKWRITIVTALLIALSSSAIGTASYFSISRAQMSAIDTTLTNALGAQPARMLERQLSRNNAQLSFYSPIAIALVDDTGQATVVRPAGTESAPAQFPEIPLSSLGNGNKPLQTFSDPITGEKYRLLARPAGRGYEAIAVTSLSEYNSTMHQILISVFFFVLGVTILGAMASWIMVRRFFAPVDSMIAAAGAIAHGETDQRVPDAPPGTELGDLSQSLNTMINSLTRSIARVEESENSLRTFISDASHEIRTPLTVIRGYTEILRSHGDINSERDLRALERIDSESQRLERLVTSLLALEGQQTVLTPESTIRLTEKVRDHFADLDVISPRPISLKLADIALTGHADAWEQLLGNITQNIARYTPPGSPVTVLLTDSNVDGRKWAHLVVDDCGPGIPASQHMDIFGRFARLDQSRSTETGGFGLGMSIMKAVVDAHGGTITLDTSPCGGLQIRIDIPI